jgi:hypothetical protein
MGSSSSTQHASLPHSLGSYTVHYKLSMKWGLYTGCPSDYRITFHANISNTITAETFIFTNSESWLKFQRDCNF